MGMIPEEIEKGPWEGHSVCASCSQALHENRYYANNSVCPHCGASYTGMSTIVRRKLFAQSEPPMQTWRQWWRGEKPERPFKWEVKKTDA